ncbi:uncharacterized protein LOC144912888 [Branchiostoma floridae x Branchiostoma belcheri]
MVRVLGGGAKSDAFPVCTGVRQGCVIAPVIFNLFLAAVMLAAKKDIRPEDCVPLTYRLDGGLFNLRRFRAPTKIQKGTILELQYADDAAVAGCTATGLQRSLTVLDNTYTRAGLSTNTGKTEVMCQGGSLTGSDTFQIKNSALNNVNSFTYLGSTLSVNCDITDEVQRRIGLASASFGRLARKVFLNRSLLVKTKVAVYRAVCLSILLYASETWTPYRHHIRTLEQFHIRCLQKILGLKWWHKVPHTEIRRRANIEPLAAILLQRQLRWVGHVIRMPENRLPRQMLYGELSAGKRTVGGQRKRFKDCLKSNLKSCGIEPQSLERLAADRNSWRQVCSTATESYTDCYNQRAETSRARRHMPAQQQGQHICEICGRVLAARIGLISHRRTHRVRETESQQ